MNEQDPNRLTADNVNDVVMQCLPGELKPDTIIVDGVVGKFGFCPQAIHDNRDRIAALLSGLPDEFMASSGGGWSFLNACMDRDGTHWAEHPTMEALFAIGTAAGFVTLPMPREMWDILPGGVPYYAVTLPDAMNGAKGDTDATD